MSDERKRSTTDAPAIARTVTPREPVPARTTTPQVSTHPIGTPSGLSPNAGTLAVAAWLRDRGLSLPAAKSWRVQIALELGDRAASFMFATTKFQITIDPQSWGFMFMHGDRTSTILVTNMAAARDADEHRLVAMTPPLKRIGVLLRDLEARYHMFFPRHHAAIRSDIPGSEPMIRAWVSSF
ncbi:MAG: hypothetical protein JWP01_2443 [Myxococcales bacterium]|nr:hypothetical protein [Myxococcales bacterium]